MGCVGTEPATIVCMYTCFSENRNDNHHLGTGCLVVRELSKVKNVELFSNRMFYSTRRLLV